MSYFKRAVLIAVFVVSSCTRLDVIQKFEASELTLPLQSNVEAQKTMATYRLKSKSNSLKNNETGAIETSIQESIILALENNSAFQADRLAPLKQATYHEQARAAFEPTLSASIASSQASDEDTDTVDGDSSSDGDTFSSSISLTQEFPTGTSVSITGGHTSGSSDGTNLEGSSTTDSLDISITQSLLRGFGRGVNLVSLKQAKLDTQISRYVLRGAAEYLVYQTELAGWNYLLAEQQIAIYADSLKLAENQLAEVKERIAVGVLADIELAAVEAELAGRREDFINAKSNLEKTRIEFYRTSGVVNWTDWSLPLTIKDTPQVPNDKMAELETHIMVALKKRSDLNEARLRKSKGELALVQTKNGLLPKLDFFISVDDGNYSGSFTSPAKETTSMEQNIELGLRFEYALSGRSSRSAHNRATLSLQQLKRALANQEELVIQEIYTAYLEIKRTAEQIEASKATQKLRDEALRAETEKFRVGKSTTLLVAQAQRDFMASRITATEAVVEHLKARLALYYKEGSLLERRGIVIEAK